MKKFEIKHCFNGSILFSLETESLKLCVEAAVKSSANLRGADLSVADLSVANLRGADLSVADLRGANLRGADLSVANLRGADLRGANLRGANLRGADLRGANLGGADLSVADLRGANLRGADLSVADLRGANLRGADLRGANLGGAKIKLGETDLLLVGKRPCLQLGPLGSRNDYLLALLTDHGVYVRTGCFFDTLAEFKKSVKATHGANEHAKEYALAIKLIEGHEKLWAKK